MLSFLLNNSCLHLIIQNVQHIPPNKVSFIVNNETFQFVRTVFPLENIWDTILRSTESKLWNSSDHCLQQQKNKGTSCRPQRQSPLPQGGRCWMSPKSSQNSTLNMDRYTWKWQKPKTLQLDWKTTEVCSIHIREHGIRHCCNLEWRSSVDWLTW